jgi:formylglycine-generating enzyme required for sulfatase activity
MKKLLFIALVAMAICSIVLSSPQKLKAQVQSQSTQGHQATSDDSESDSWFGDTTSYRQRPILKPGELVATDPNTPAGTTWVNPKDGLTYVWITPGKFMMGCSPGDTNCHPDEKPHEVTIDHGFWIGQTLVTQGAYKRVTGENPSFYKRGDQFPVEKVDYIDAYGYCVAVGMRLPKEDEWEYAARANTTAARYSDDLDEIAWYKDNSFGHSHEVAKKEPNAFHLYDMLGNMWQWTATLTGRGNGGVVLRGGSYTTRPAYVRVSVRGLDNAEGARRFSSFRCVSGNYTDTNDDIIGYDDVMKAMQQGKNP